MLWLCKVKYFRLYKIVKLYRVTLASFNLEGEAQLWFQMIKQELIYVTWENFRDDLYIQTQSIWASFWRINSCGKHL